MLRTTEDQGACLFDKTEDHYSEIDNKGSWFDETGTCDSMVAFEFVL